MKYFATLLGGLVLAVMLAAPSASVHAQPSPVAPQSDEDHSAHHPGSDQTAAPSPSPAPALPSQPGGMMDMRSMMRGGATMGMMPMMRSGEMTGMMPVTRGGRMMGGMPFEHVEGRLAFLKTELKITPTQEPEWDKFAAAIRSVAQSTKAMYEEAMGDKQMPQDRQSMQDRQTMQGAESAVARLERYERILSARLEAVRTVKDVFRPLYAALSGEQKKVADELLANQMGVF